MSDSRKNFKSYEEEDHENDLSCSNCGKGIISKNKCLHCGKETRREIRFGQRVERFVLDLIALIEIVSMQALYNVVQCFFYDKRRVYILG